MPPIETFYDTTHVLKRMRERGVTLDQLKIVVNLPDSKKQQYRGDNGGFVYKFQKSIGELTIVAIAEVKKSECWLISGWFVE